MGRTGFQIVPKMITANVMQIYIVIKNGETRQIAEIHCPNDGQMNDNLELAESICAAIKKRIRKSV